MTKKFKITKQNPVSLSLWEHRVGCCRISGIFNIFALHCSRGQGYSRACPSHSKGISNGCHYRSGEWGWRGKGALQNIQQKLVFSVPDLGHYWLVRQFGLPAWWN